MNFEGGETRLKIQKITLKPHLKNILVTSFEIESRPEPLPWSNRK
jgi:hypothetical protein